MRAKLTQIW